MPLSRDFITFKSVPENFDHCFMYPYYIHVPDIGLFIQKANLPIQTLTTTMSEVGKEIYLYVPMKYMTLKNFTISV